MDEQEILSSLKAWVAHGQSSIPHDQRLAPPRVDVSRIDVSNRDQSSSADDQRPAPPRVDVSKIDVSSIGRLSAEVWASREAVGQLNPRKPGVLNRLAQIAKKVLQRSLSWYTRPLQVFHFNVARAIEEQGTAISSIEPWLLRLENEIEQSRLRSQDEILKIRNELLQEILMAIEAIQEQQTPHIKLLLQLEDEILKIRNEPLRATELAIQELQTPYVEIFRGLSPVVDLGCGGGEFLALLKEKGIAAYGVDSHHAACEVARRKLLKIVEADLIEHLRQLPDRSLGGIFSARVIEYLPTNLQMEFVSLCSKKIKPGGLVVIETTNPEASPGFGRTSYLDPTRLRPVPPDLLKSALESNCFQDVKICVLAPVEGTLVPITQSADFFNHTERFSRMLPGASNSLGSSQAYATVGRRS